MMRTWLTLAVVLGATTTAQAKLELQNIQAVYSLFGPARPNLDIYPHDQVLFRFVVSGARVDAEGKIDTSMTLQMTDPTGKVLLNEKSPLQGILALGGNTFAGSARLNVGEQIPPGDYILTVTVRDNAASEEVSFQRKLTAKPAGFRIVAPQFSYDAEGKVPAPPGGLVGQILHFRLQGIGFDRDQGKLDTAMNVQVLDVQGKEMLPKPILAELRSEDPAVVKKVTALTFNGNLALNRPGQYTLRITLNDRLGKKSTQFETPLDIRAP
jgi:hypothetical protein